MTIPSIGDLGFLSDCHTAALVDREACVQWWCPPRFDAGSVFGRLLGPGAGHWSLQPTAPFEAERRYDDGTLVLRTTFTAEAGQVDVVDALALEPGARGHDIGRVSPQVLRRIEVVHGTVELETVFAPRMEYGLTVPHTAPVDGGVTAWGGPVRLTLRAPFPLDAEVGGARGRVTVVAGERVELAARFTEARADASAPPEVTVDDTLEAWRSWSSLHQDYGGEHAEAVRRSALVVQGLTRSICVDPRDTPVARGADVHLALRPGTNLALLNGLLHELIARDAIDHADVARHTVGYDDLGVLAGPARAPGRGAERVGGDARSRRAPARPR